MAESGIVEGIREKVFGIIRAPPATLSDKEAQEMIKRILNPPKEVRDFLFKWVYSK